MPVQSNCSTLENILKYIVPKFIFISKVKGKLTENGRKLVHEELSEDISLCGEGFGG